MPFTSKLPLIGKTKKKTFLIGRWSTKTKYKWKWHNEMHFSICLFKNPIKRKFWCILIDKVSNSFLCMWRLSCLSARRVFIPCWISFAPLLKEIDDKCVGLFVDLNFISLISMSVFMQAHYTVLLVYISRKFWNWRVWVPKTTHVFQNCF